MIIMVIGSIMITNGDSLLSGSPMRAAKIQASLRIRAVSPEPPLSLLQAASQEEPSDRKPDPWPL